MTHPLTRFRLPAAMLAAVLVLGTGGYMLLEHWPFLDALYMTITTISTVGFSEVHPLDTGGRVFTIGLILGGVGTIFYAFGVLAEIVFEGDIARYRRQRSMDRQREALRDHFIVCGYGRIGTQVVSELESAKVRCIAIDNNPEAISRLEHENRLHVADDAASEDVLKQAGIERARGLICAVDSDERAVYIVLAAKAVRRDLYVLARAGRPESIRRLELAGADRVISPYRMAGHMMAELALRPALVEVMDFLQHGDTPVGVEELIVRQDYGAIGRTLDDLGAFGDEQAHLLAVRRKDGDLVVNPDGAFQLQEGDLIVAFGSA
ncbi:MAG TPA: potassium channel protein, partial [Candidatus Dormibacteraeota bacterium]